MTSLVQRLGRAAPELYDADDPGELLTMELVQRVESGYDVTLVANRLAAHGGIASHSPEHLLGLLDELAGARRSPEWAYDEPEGFEAIASSLPTAGPMEGRAGSGSTVADRIHAAWLGRVAGCNVGKPVELGTHWTRQHLRDYLDLADSYPLRDYVPVLSPMPPRFQLREDNWRETTRGNVNGSARDDDIDYSILALHLLETFGRGFTAADVGATWLRLLPYRQVFTAERVTYRNLVQGVPADKAGAYRNPYREWIGAQIRGDVFGLVHPGDPRSAALLAFKDASLSHVGNGVYGEMWVAALVAAAFTAGTARAAVAESLRHVPPQSRLHESVRCVLRRFDEGATWDDALTDTDTRWGTYNWIHSVNNAAAVTAGLLWGDGDVALTIGRTVMAGLDTDSNGATAGAVVGVLSGTSGLPSQLIEPLKDTVRSAMFGFDGSRISDLAARTSALVADVSATT